MLRLNHQPDFMLVHPMGTDYAGHCFGGGSAEYRNRAIAMDSLLARYVPRWQGAGYTVVITSDHGMNADKSHGGPLPDVRETPLFCLGPGFEPGVYRDELSQLAIAPLLCHLLGIPPLKRWQTFLCLAAT